MNLRSFVILAVGVVALAVILPFFATGYVVYIANLLMVFVVLSLGLHVVIGEAGQFSLAHVAFYGVGIYTTARCTDLMDLPFVVSLLAGAGLAALCGFLIGFLSLRMRDIYLTLATFAFGQAAQWVLLNWTPVTGGPNGLNIKPAVVLGVPILSDAAAFPVVAAGTLIFIGLVSVLHASAVGRSFRAVRESEIAAAAVGINVRRAKLLAFTLSAFVAGAAGGMFTVFSTFIHPDSLGFQTTILVLTMLVVGGIGSVSGAIGGAIVFGLVSELLRQMPSYQEVIYGAILMVCMVCAPRGLAALLGSFRRA